MSVQETNFDDILSFYFHGTDAREALDELVRRIDTAGQDAWLKRMLRDYRLDPIYDPDEIAFRNGVDDLMVFCNVVEYAAAGRLIGMQASRKWSWAPLARVLRNAHVERYYKDFYPDRLPQLLLKRIDGLYQAVEKAGAESHCLRFMELDRQFMANHHSGYLLKMLDDFIIEGVRFSDVTRHFEVPERVVESLLKAEDKKELIDQTVNEFGQFLTFCGVLAEELDDAADFPLLQSEAWARYAYWFEIIEPQMNRRLGRTLDKFITWEPPPDSTDASKEIREFVAAAKANLHKLFSKAYGSRLDAILAGADNSQSSFQ